MKILITGIVVIIGFLLAITPFVKALNDICQLTGDVAKVANDDLKNNEGKGCIGCVLVTVIFLIVAFIVGLFYQ